MAHIGSAHSETELVLLVERARGLLGDAGQGELDLGIEATTRKVSLVPPAVDTNSDAGLFAASPVVDTPPSRGGKQSWVVAPQVVATSSRLLFEVLAQAYDGLGFASVGGETFRGLVIARIVEPTSILDTGRVLTDLGQTPTSARTMRRTLTRCLQCGYRDQIARVCLTHAVGSGDVSLCLYDVTTLYFEAEKEDDLRKVDYSKNVGSTRRSSWGYWSTDTGFRWRLDVSRATRPSAPRSSRS